MTGRMSRCWDPTTILYLPLSNTRTPRTRACSLPLPASIHHRPSDHSTIIRPFAIRPFGARRRRRAAGVCGVAMCFVFHTTREIEAATPQASLLIASSRSERPSPARGPEPRRWAAGLRCFCAAWAGQLRCCDPVAVAAWLLMPPQLWWAPHLFVVLSCVCG